MYTKEEEEKKFIMSTGMFHKCQMGIEFDIYEWGEINFFFLPYPRNIVENWNRPLIQPCVCFISGMSMKTDRENVLNVCVRMYVCLYIHC